MFKKNLKVQITVSFSKKGSLKKTSYCSGYLSFFNSVFFICWTTISGIEEHFLHVDWHPFKDVIGVFRIHRNHCTWTWAGPLVQWKKLKTSIIVLHWDDELNLSHKITIQNHEGTYPHLIRKKAPIGVFFGLIGDMFLRGSELWNCDSKSIRRLNAIR